MTFHNKLERLSLATFSSLVLYLQVRPGAYTRVEHLKGASLGKAPALLENIRLDYKSLPGANVLANYKKVVTYGRKKFYNIGTFQVLLSRVGS
jgi:hypothetical protein